MLSEITPEDNYEPLITARYSRELLSLQLAPLWQRQGVGRSLVSRIADELAEENVTRLLVRVLIDNPNIAFYERLGVTELVNGHMNGRVMRPRRSYLAGRILAHAKPPESAILYRSILPPGFSVLSSYHSGASHRPVHTQMSRLHTFL